MVLTFLFKYLLSDSIWGDMEDEDADERMNFMYAIDQSGERNNLLLSCQIYKF